MIRVRPLVLIAAAVFGAAAVLVATARRDDDNGVAIVSAPSAAEARALGARWRESKSEGDARAYAQALASAGLYDDLLSAIEERGLFSGDEVAASLYRAEATLRQGRFADAVSALSRSDNPYAAFARARASYALSGKAESASGDLQRALRGPKELAAEAWLFRARLALDANDFSAADAAARRAAEAGADRGRIDAVRIESLIRRGELDFAGKLLAERSTSRRNAAPVADDFQLAAMIKLRAGDFQGASRLIDAALNSGNGNARLLAALAKWRNGDHAQAQALLRAELAAAPENWRALDLAAGLALSLGRREEAKALLSRLEHERPSAAALRRMRTENADDAFEAARALDENFSGVGATLLGGGAELPPSIAEPTAPERRVAALAVALRGADRRALRAAAAELGGGPVAAALSGEALVRAGDVRAAKSAYARAALSDPSFFAPVDRLAQLYREEADFGRAIDVVSAYLKNNSGHAPALIVLAGLLAASGEEREAADIYASLPPAVLFAEAETAVLYSRTATAVGPVMRRQMLKAAAAAPSDLILGQVLAAAGEKERAARAFRAGLIAAPWNRKVAAFYLSAMTELGRAEEANSLLREIGGRTGLEGPPTALRNNDELTGVTTF